MNGQRSAPDGKSKVTLSLPQGKTPCPATRELGRQFERALGTQGAYAVKLATVALHWCRAHGATWCDAHGVASRVAKATKVGERTIKKLLKIQRVAPARMAAVARGEVSANKVLEEVAPSKQPKAADAFLHEIVTGCKRTLSAIARTAKERRVVDPAALSEAQAWLKKVLAALEAIDPEGGRR